MGNENHSNLLSPAPILPRLGSSRNAPAPYLDRESYICISN
jgi:hypothetical protein